MNNILQYLDSLDQDLLLYWNGSESLFWDGVMWVITSTQVWIPMFVVLLYVLVKNNSFKSFWAIVFSIVLTIVLCDQVASGICKPLFERFRPTQNPDIMYLVDIVNGYRGGRYGFISSHAANTFGLCVFLSLLFRKMDFSILMFIWASLSSYSRIYLGVHYLGDIFLGCLVGCLWGFLIYKLYCFTNKLLKIDRKHLISELYTCTGYKISDINLISVTLLLTYAFIPFIGMLFTV